MGKERGLVVWFETVRQVGESGENGGVRELGGNSPCRVTEVVRR